MQENDEPNILRILDETESFRRARQLELNAGHSREILESLYGRVYSTDQLRAEFEVQGFFAPMVVVKSLADGSLGSFEFQHMPRYYFNYQKDK